VLARVRVPIRFRHRSLRPDAGIEPPRGDRYGEGCAIFVGVEPVIRAGRTVVVAELWQQR
jgi:hypothetical protein